MILDPKQQATKCESSGNPEVVIPPDDVCGISAKQRSS